jgi:hypothetical protein
MTANAHRQCRGAAEFGDLLLNRSSAAPGHRSPLVSPKPSRHSTIAERRKTESTTFSESFRVDERLADSLAKLGPVPDRGIRVLNRSHAFKNFWAWNCSPWVRSLI